MPVFCEYSSSSGMGDLIKKHYTQYTKHTSKVTTIFHNTIEEDYFLEL